MNVVLPVRKGGLGNQMFQVAAAMVVAKEQQKSIVLPREMPHKHNTLQLEYEESIFQHIEHHLPIALDANVLFTLQQEGFTLYPGEPGFESWSPDYQVEKLILHGYFQYYPALEKHKELIAKTYLQNLKEFSIEPNQSHIGIHVRRGDYLQFPDVYPMLGPSYYCRAIQRIEALVSGYKQYMIFSDDIEWCKEQDMFQSLPNVVFVDEKNEIKTLCRMIACAGGFICANSSFSWWGAFLGSFQKNSPCIVPEDWCKGATRDLFPKEWICIGKKEGALLFFEPGTLNLHEKRDTENIVVPLNQTVEVYIDSLTYSGSSNPKLFLQLEPLAIKNMENHLLSNYELYDTIYTFNETVLQRCPNAIKSILPACSWISGNHYHHIDISKKQFQISCITGSKQMAEGHTYRLLLYFNQTALQRDCGLPIIFYRSSAGQPLPELDENPFIHADKFPLFETYQYSLVIENSSQPNYFTEKLIDCLITKTIPIYYGCPNIAQYFDTTGWILLTDPTPETRIEELVKRWQQANYTKESYASFHTTIEANYKVCKEKYSGFYSKFNHLFLKNPAFE